MIPLPADSWLWIVDDDLVRTLFAAAPHHTGLAARAAAEPALVEAVRHWLRAEPAAALAALEPALERDNADALVLGAQLCFETGDLARAARLYHRLAESVPDHPYAAFNEGLCYLRQEQWQQAAEALQRAVLLTPSHAEAWHLLGTSLLRLDRLAEAASAFGQCLSLRPGYVPAVCGKAAALQLQGKPGEALALYLPLLEAAPEREEILLNALRAAVEAGDWQQVRRLAIRVSAISPGSLPAKEALAHADLAQQRYEEALAAFGELASLAPAFLEPWYHMGVCQFRLGRYAEAAEAFRAALQVDSHHLESRLALAECLRLAGQAGEARSTLEAVVELPGAPAEAWVRLGLLRADAGELEEALAALERARQQGAAESDAGMAELEAAVAALLQQRGDYARAADLYRLALAVRPDDATLLFNYGGALASMERMEEAQAAWKQALERDPALAPALIEALETQPVRNHSNGAA
jgi:tetratricopeptide (TPR) repeat protein